MRYYRIEIDGFQPISSQVNGKNDPGALDIEIDVPFAYMDAPAGAATIRVWGVPLKASFGLPGITQGSDLNGKNIKVYAGMAKGLPLATQQSAHQGLILQGMIFQAYGNWVGTDMTLDMNVTVGLTADGDGTQDKPANILVYWTKGQTMAAALKNTLTTAFPDYKQSINISDSLVLGETECAYYQTLDQLGQHITEVSKSILTDPDYNGVHISVSGDTLIVSDATVGPDSVVQVAFNDLIGQPTWFAPGSLQANMVLRGDLNVDDVVQFPQGIPTISTQAQMSNQPQDQTSFSGKFRISLVRHIGHFRQPDASSWITTINAFPETA